MKIILKTIITFSALYALSGCALQQLNSDMMNNKFFEYSAIENDVYGKYTASIGPCVSTYIIGADGNGVNCYPQQGNTIISKIKIYSKVSDTYHFIVENGQKYQITTNKDGSLSIVSYGFSYNLIPDESLEKANLSCKDKLLSLSK